MKKKIISAILAMVMILSCVAVLGACNDDPPAECTNHVDENGDKKCDNCGVDYPGGGGEVAPHRCKDEDEDGICDVEGCGKTVEKGEDGGDDNVEYAWDSVELSFMMMVEDSSAELTSTCERYIAGDYSGTKDNIDTAVQKRNEAAYEHAKVNYTDTMYDYFPNTSDYGWGEASSRIMEQVLSPNAENLPDVYVHFIYDMVGASLQGCFANLYAEERLNSEGDSVEVNNYFPFLKFRDAFFDYDDESEKFNEEEEGQGYMYEYMTTLTLSKKKMFLLASDYFTDLVRAFYVMPVNVTLLEQLGQDKTICPDDLVGNDGAYTLDDFYEEVYNGDWTYSRLAQFSEAVYKDEQNAGREDLGDTLGLVLQAGGLTGSGMMYSTKCVIVERTMNREIRDFEYAYPATNEKLFDLFSAMNELMKKTGVMSVRGTDEEKLIAQGATDAQTCCENRFSVNKVLFGSVIQVGAFEREVYQSMKDKGGFGLVPVPRYSDTIEDGYFTQIHNVGRIGAISVKTTKFDQCTAFLNYQSTHSSDILEDYYKYKLQYSALGGESGTIDMMNFIRNNVRTAFDKTWEDAIGYFYQDMNKRWHAILIAADFEVPDFRTQYNQLIAEKQNRLAALVEKYDALSN